MEWHPVDQAELSSESSLSTQSGGVDITAQHVSIGGDVIGRDKIVTVYQVAPTVEIPLPPESTRPPRTVSFVGREHELKYYANRLAYSHLAIITGMPGVGKTSLAAALIDRFGQVDLTFWHSFHKTEGISAVIWQIAGFLAKHGQPDLWEMLNRWRQTGGQPPPSQVLFDYLFQMLRGREYLLCFDDFQFVDDDPLLDQFIQRLKPALAAGELSLIVTSRRVPAFVQADEFDPLAGLSAEDAYRFMTQHNLPADGIRSGRAAGDDSTAFSPQLNLSSSEIAVNLYHRTEGNPLLLLLAMNGFKRASAPERFLARLFSDVDVERFLVKEVDAQLSQDERAVMEAVAVLLGYEGTREAIEAILDGRNARLALNALSQRYLLTVKEAEDGRAYGAHAILRDFYQDALSVVSHNFE
jgi:ATP/maltotriose-dependent transcriptional regulator MalT